MEAKIASMPPAAADEEGEVSRWWLRTIGIVMVLGFSGLILITVLGYKNAPPIPGTVVAADGTTLFTKADVGAGQSVFLKYGLMNNGTIWGHGAMLGPDFSAEALHRMGLDAAEALAQEQLGRSYATLDAAQKAMIEAQVAVLLKHNRYDPETDTLTLTEPETSAWKKQIGYWQEYFSHPSHNAGLKADLISDQTELKQFTSFVTWAAWASVTKRPGKDYSYTNNFPYDPLVGNHPAPAVTLWSALSLIALLGGIAGVLLLSGRFEHLGWISAGRIVPKIRPGNATPGQLALVKFFVIVAAVFLFQTLLGGAIAHYRIEPDGFYGLPLERIFPSNLLRTWHLQSAIMWIATAYVAAALFLGTTLRKTVPPALKGWANFLFIAFVGVISGSLLGEWLGMEQMLGDWWFWVGNQGWEYLELGRLWQYLLAVGLLVWFGVLWWIASPSRIDDAEAKPLVRMFMVAALAIPVFYLPALFYGAETNFTVVDTWRFWIVHLWVEGFFEFFATTVVALIFYQLGLARRNTALRVIYLDAILYFGGGLIGTGHHWYFTGHGGVNMAAASVVSALEVVPLTLLTLDAWAFVKTAKAEQADSQSRAIIKAHKWTIYFLMAVGFWNFFGAGVFGFLINLPIVSYYEMGTQLTANHAHGSMMGVFGMLAIAVMAFVLRQTAHEEDWPKIEKWLKITFWGTNVGLLMMILLSLFPSGVLQLWDVLENGYWHARSHAYTRSTTALVLEWMRFPGDMVFIVFGSVPLMIAAIKAWLAVRRRSVA